MIPAAAPAQVSIGSARVIDGDTIEMAGERFRLHAIDAPEGTQTCMKGGEAWACGKDAAALLTTLIANKGVSCNRKDTDAHGRNVAVCSAGGVDLGRTMVEAGLAVALPQFSDDYVEAEARRKAHRIGIWASDFQMPAEYRAAHPEQFRGPPPASAPRRQSFAARPVSSASELYFRSCAEARAAGRAPVYRGQPGYRSGLDGDNDGIACEPYRGR